MDIFRYLLSIFVVGGLLAVAVWLSKKFRGNIGLEAIAGLRILAVTAVGPKEQLVVVEFQKKVILLGVTQNSISRLDCAESEPTTPSQPATGLPVSDKE